MLVISVVILALAEVGFAKEPNNVCYNYYDYPGIQSSDSCYYSKDMEVRMPLLATQNNYPIEEHTVTTKDGYILTVYRMPQLSKPPKGVVVLMHPATTSSVAWVDKGNTSLGLYLHNQGYEVWLGNMRGTSYSRKHVSLDPSNVAYWDFSYHEHGIYDVPATIDTAVQVSKEKVFYVGYSMGSTSAAIYASARADHAKANVKAFVLLAPAIYLNYTNIVVKLLSQYEWIIYVVGTLLHQTELLSQTQTILITQCNNNLFGMLACSLLFQFIFGFNLGQLYTPHLAAYFSRSTDAISLKSFVHYLQFARRGLFAPFDYGPLSNMRIYNQTEPPNYPIEKINVPMYVSSGANDVLVNPRDVDDFYFNLNSTYCNKRDILGFNHMDFIYGRDINISINIRIQDFFDNFGENCRCTSV